jgi:glycosyltransferase involved in cell wall biosynthesis
VPNFSADTNVSARFSESEEDCFLNAVSRQLKFSPMTGNDSAMHIIHVFPSHSWGGAEIYSLELAERQIQRGLKVSFWGVKNSRIIRDAEKRNIPVITAALPRRLNLVMLPETVRVLKAAGATHLHLHWSGGPWAFLGIKFFLPLKLIYHNHMWISHYKYDPFHWVAYQFVDHLIIAGERAKRAARKYLSIATSKLEVVPYGIDLTRSESVHSTRPEFSLPPDAKVFGMFSRIDRQKGTKEFLSALEICMGDPKVYGVLVGDPTLNEEDAKKYQSELEILLEREPLRSRLIRFQSRKDYLNILNVCDVIVQPSYHESYSLLILDAFMLAKPVISTNSGGTPDLVTEERGWLVPPRNVDKLTVALQTAARDLNVVREKGKRAKNYVFKNHSFDSVLEKLKRIY